MVKYPLAECIARPDNENGRRYPLTDHLMAVAKSLGDPKGNSFSRLGFLAGLLHDTGKACTPWQDYIRRSSRSRKRGEPHSFLGAMFFALLLDELLKIWQLSRKEKNKIIHTGINFLFFIYHHHGPINDIILVNPPWQGQFSADAFDQLDLTGLLDMVIQYFPELKTKRNELISREYRQQHVADLPWQLWQNTYLGYVLDIKESGNVYVESSRLYLHNTLDNHRLIQADRFDAANIFPCEAAQTIISPDQAERILFQINDFTNERRKQFAIKGADEAILEKRETCRLNALKIFQKENDCRIFTLELPTGYGKTLTALSVALQSITKGLHKRIIYVAPFISILSQSAIEIKSFTGLEVFTHHHLSILEKDISENHENDEEDIVIESWLSPIIVTTYNQLFRALFPNRAQQTLRMAGLRDAFIIIDEPQTIDTRTWNPFLSVLESMVHDIGARVLLVTATLPELSGGILTSRCCRLAQERPLKDRYRVKFLGPMDEDSLVNKVINSSSQQHSVAVIMNTIKDAAEIYLRLNDYFKNHTDIRLTFLSGRMTPLHKQHRINEINNLLKNGKKTIVICTQVLEAGVDLSFRVIYRALPVFPSIIQAGGRCNRHGEGELGQLYVFSFLRGGEKETRQYVYRDRVQCEVTDLCLSQVELSTETQIFSLINTFYSECFKRKDGLVTLESLVRAASGYPTEVGGIQPFGSDDFFKFGIFVPKVFDQVPQQIQKTLDYFGLTDIEDIWNYYVSPGFLSSLEFTDRKRFMVLIYQFMVQVNEKEAQNYSYGVENREIRKLSYPSLYRPDIGLSLLKADEIMMEQFF